MRLRTKQEVEKAMSKKALTVGLLVSVAITLISYDIWVYCQPPEEGTISEVVLSLHRRFPGFTLGIGVLLGHWLWPQKIKEGA
jgi:hypothetical protein